MPRVNGAHRPNAGPATTVRRHTPAARSLRLAAVALLVPLLGGWKVMTIEEARLAKERTSGQFNASTYVDAIWHDKILGLAQQSAQPLADILNRTQTDFNNAASALGQLSDDAARASFFARGNGKVLEIDSSSMAGSITLRVEGLADDWDVRLATGPVVLGTSLRDAAPFLHFNDFANQIDYAEVGNELTSRALHSVHATLEQVAIGDEIQFVGAFSMTPASRTITLTPLVLTPGAARASNQGASQ